VDQTKGSGENSRPKPHRPISNGSILKKTKSEASQFVPV